MLDSYSNCIRGGKIILIYISKMGQEISQNEKSFVMQYGEAW
jgi:hypothetical protein